MAARRNAGLTIGQSLTLIFGFVLGSVIIFVFGIWVGRELSRQKDKDDRAVVVRPVATLPLRDAPRGAATPTPRAPGEVGGPIGSEVADERPTRPRPVPPSATQVATATRTSTRRPPPTDTPRRDTPTPAQERRFPTSAEAAGRMWTVQAATTNDQVQALVAARRLRSRGYDAFTSQTNIGGVAWYRIQVGRFEQRAEAEQMVERLRKEGMPAAFVERIR